MALLTGALLTTEAQADTLPPGVLSRQDPLIEECNPDPRDPLGYCPAVSSNLAFDKPTGGDQVADLASLTSWKGAPADWNPPGLDGPGVNGHVGGNNNGGNLQTGGNGGGNNGCGNGNGGPSGGGNCGGGEGSPPGVPGPLPVLGIAVTWGWARRMRQRMRGLS